MTDNTVNLYLPYGDETMVEQPSSVTVSSNDETTRLVVQGDADPGALVVDIRNDAGSWRLTVNASGVQLHALN